MALARLTPELSEAEVRRRRRAFGDGPVSPLHVEIHGLRLRYEPTCSPPGWFDGIREERAEGWVYDPANSPVRVFVQIDGITRATGLADQYRSDLADAGYGDGRCSFSIPLAGLLPNNRPLRLEVVLPDHEWQRLAGTPVLTQPLTLR